MTFEHVFAGIHVSDRDVAVDWYERLLARPPDLIPNAREAAWRLTDTGWLYVIVGAGDPGTSINTVLLADLDSLVRAAGEAGITSGGVQTNEAGVRVVVLEDPDGNRLQLGQTPE